MALQIRRGNLVDLPVLAHGELALTTDEGLEQVYVGSASGNLRVPTLAQVQAMIDGLVGSAPELLNTLQELALALGDNPDSLADMGSLISTLQSQFGTFSSETTSALANKEPVIGAKSNENPKNHDRYSDAEAKAAIREDMEVYNSSFAVAATISTSKVFIYYSGAPLQADLTLPENAPLKSVISIRKESQGAGGEVRLYAPSGETINGSADVIFSSAVTDIYAICVAAGEWRAV